MRRGTAWLVSAAALFVPALARADGDDRVQVHVTGDSGAVLERRIEDTELWESLCVGACDARVPLAGTYRVNGRGIRPSLPISLVPSPHVLHLEVKPAYSAAMAGGITLLVVGPLAMVGGFAAAIVGANQTPPPCSFGGPCVPEPVDHASLIGGILTLLTGALLSAGGVVALALADHSRTNEIVSLSGRGLTLTF